MRLVTGLAGYPAGVLIGIDLRKIFGSCSAGGVAADAKCGGVGLAGIDRRGIVGVLCQRSVAGLAVHPRVFPGAFCLRNVGVAAFAGLVPREADGVCRNLRNGGSAIVPILPEAARDDKTADRQKRQGSHCEQPGQTKEMACIPEHALELPPIRDIPVNQSPESQGPITAPIQRKKNNGCMCARSQCWRRPFMGETEVTLAIRPDGVDRDNLGVCECGARRFGSFPAANV